MSLQSIRLPAMDTRLVCHGHSVYKFKLKYQSDTPGGAFLPCMPRVMHRELEAVMRSLISQLFHPDTDEDIPVQKIKTDHFLCDCHIVKWPVANKIQFSRNGRQVQACPFMFMVNVSPKVGLSTSQVHEGSSTSHLSYSVMKRKNPGCVGLNILKTQYSKPSSSANTPANYPKVQKITEPLKTPVVYIRRLDEGSVANILSGTAGRRPAENEERQRSHTTIESSERSRGSTSTLGTEKQNSKTTIESSERSRGSTSTLSTEKKNSKTTIESSERSRGSTSTLSTEKKNSKTTIESSERSRGSTSTLSTEKKNSKISGLPIDRDRSPENESTSIIISERRSVANGRRSDSGQFSGDSLVPEGKCDDSDSNAIKEKPVNENVQNKPVVMNNGYSLMQGESRESLPYRMSRTKILNEISGYAVQISPSASKNIAQHRLRQSVRQQSANKLKYLSSSINQQSLKVSNEVGKGKGREKRFSAQKVVKSDTNRRSLRVSEKNSTRSELESSIESETDATSSSEKNNHMTRAKAKNRASKVRNNSENIGPSVNKAVALKLKGSESGSGSSCESYSQRSHKAGKCHVHNVTDKSRTYKTASKANSSLLASKCNSSSVRSSSKVRSSPVRSSRVNSSPDRSSSKARSSPVKSSRVNSSPVRSSRVNSSPDRSSSKARSSPVKSSRVNSSPDRSSKARSSPVRSSKARSSPVRSSSKDHSSPVRSSYAASNNNAKRFSPMSEQEGKVVFSSSGPLITRHTRSVRVVLKRKPMHHRQLSASLEEPEGPASKKLCPLKGVAGSEEGGGVSSQFSYPVRGTQSEERINITSSAEDVEETKRQRRSNSSSGKNRSVSFARNTRSGSGAVRRNILKGVSTSDSRGDGDNISSQNSHQEVPRQRRDRSVIQQEELEEEMTLQEMAKPHSSDHDSQHKRRKSSFFGVMDAIVTPIKKFIYGSSPEVP